MQYNRELNCVSCGSKNICFGYTGSTSNVFVPSGIIVFHGYRTRSYVCLECGHITQYLPEDKVKKLRDKFKKKLG